MSSGSRARQDHLRALRPRPHLGDHGLDAAALLVALAVHLLGTREERLDLPEVDEDVVPVSGLLDDARHDLADAVDVLVVHHCPLGLSDPLLDDLLGRLCGNAAEVLRGDVGALHLLGSDVRPVDIEVVVRDQCVRALAVLDLEPLELLERSLPGLLDEPGLDVRGELDREHAKVAVPVDLDRRVAGSAGRLLVRREQPVLKGGDQRPRFDAFVSLDLSDCFQNLSAHRCSSPSSIRFPRTIAS